MLAAYYYGYVATQLMGGRLSETVGAKMVYGTGIMLSGVFTLMGPVAVRAKLHAFIAIRVLTGAASVWPHVQEVDMSRNKKSEWKNIGQHESGVGLHCPDVAHLHLTFIFYLYKRKPILSLPSPEKRALIYLYRILLPVSRRWVRGKNKTELMSGVRCGVNEISGLLVCYIALIGSWLSKFWDNLSTSFDCLGLKNGTDRIFRNVCNYQSMLRNIPEERRYQNRTYSSETNESQCR